MQFFNFLKNGNINSKGFTLIEIMTVIVILGILAGIAVPSVFAVMERAREDVFFAQFLQGIDGKVCP